MNKLYRPRISVSTAKPRKRRVNPKILLFMLLVVVLAAAIFLTVKLIDSSTDTLSGGIEMPFSAGSEYFGLPSGLVHVNGTDLLSINLKGVEQWRATVSFADGSLVHSDSLIALWKGAALQLFSLDGKELFKNDFLGNIQFVRCGTKYISVLSKDEKDELTLTVLDLAGTKLQELPMTGQNLLDFGFTGELDMLWTLTLGTDGVVPVSKITTYNSERNSITGVTSINDQIPHKLSFTGDEIFVIGTNHIMWYNYLGQKKDSHLVYGWEYAGGDWTGGTPTLVFIPRKGSAAQDSITTARVIKPGVQESSYNLAPNCFSLMLGNNKLYAFTEQGVHVYAFDSDAKTQYKFETNITAVQSVGTTHALLETLNGLELVQLP